MPTPSRPLRSAVHVSLLALAMVVTACAPTAGAGGPDAPALAQSIVDRSASDPGPPESALRAQESSPDPSDEVGVAPDFAAAGEPPTLSGAESASEGDPACAWASPRTLQLGQRGEVLRGDPQIAQIALTFDAGAGSGSVGELLDVLLSRSVRATFFVAGAFAERYPLVLQRLAAEGHELANHSYSHPDFRNLTERQIRDELRRGTAAIEAAAGVPITALWRPPFGGRDDRVLRVIEEEGFRSIYWTYDSGDWIAGATTAGVQSNVLGRATNGAVVVHHVSPEATARAMPAVIDDLRKRGYELVTVSELMGYSADCPPRL